MGIYIDNTKGKKSVSATTKSVENHNRNPRVFSFIDNRLETVTRKKLMNDMEKSELNGKGFFPIQLSDEKKRNKKKEKISYPIWKPNHSQEDIQNFIIDMWIKDTVDEMDEKRANYMLKYKDSEGGWCDGWSYVLLGSDGDLAILWRIIDDALTTKDFSDITSTIRYQAVGFARDASLYHILNADPPAEDPQKTDYEDVGYHLCKKRIETWRHDFKEDLPLSVIRQEIKQLDEGQTLRLTSRVHDAAVKRIRDGFVIAETENYGVQQSIQIENVMEIISKWENECRKTGESFFTQSMVE